MDLVFGTFEFPMCFKIVYFNWTDNFNSSGAMEGEKRPKKGQKYEKYIFCLFKTNIKV